MRELDFRDGRRAVVEHLADMMIDLPLHTLTYEQAVEKANWRLANDHVQRSYDGIVQGHFRQTGGRQ